MPVKKTIRFNDLDGNEVEQDWYFALGKTDAMDMDLVHRENISEHLTEIVKNKDGKALLGIWRELLFRSVGKRVGNQLVKNEEVLDEFRYGGAYEQFFSELIESDDGGAEFFTSILPADIQEKVAAEEAKTFTKDEMLAMSDEEFFRTFGTDETSYSPEVLLIAFQRKNQKAA